MKYKAQGSTLEEKIASLERQINRMLMIEKNHTVYIPPWPLSGYAESGPILFRFMFPASGKVSNVEAFIDSVPNAEGRESTGRMKVSIKEPDGHIKSSDFIVKKGYYSTKIDVAIDKGSMMTIESDEAKGVWLSFLYQIKVTDTEIKQLSLDLTGGESE